MMNPRSHDSPGRLWPSFHSPVADIKFGCVSGMLDMAVRLDLISPGAPREEALQAKKLSGRVRELAADLDEYRLQLVRVGWPAK